MRYLCGLFLAWAGAAGWCADSVQYVWCDLKEYFSSAALYAETGIFKHQLWEGQSDRRSWKGAPSMSAAAWCGI